MIQPSKRRKLGVPKSATKTDESEVLGGGEILPVLFPTYFIFIQRRKEGYESRTKDSLRIHYDVNGARVGGGIYMTKLPPLLHPPDLYSLDETGIRFDNHRPFQPSRFNSRQGSTAYVVQANPPRSILYHIRTPDPPTMSKSERGSPFIIIIIYYPQKQIYV